MTDVLRLEHLGIDFSSEDGPLRAVHDVSLSVPRGGIVCLVGESGCGKSLTARAVMGLLPEGARASGRILLETPRGASDLLSLPPRELRRLRGPGMAMIFQEPMTALNPVLRVGRQVDEALRLHLGLSGREARAETIRLFGEVGIPAPESRYADYPHQLSGGMRQRVVIAIAISCDPDILICDEPTTALDVTIQAKILELIQEMQRKRNISVIYITHDLGVVAKVADYVAVMYAGKIVEKGTAYELYFEPRHPYTWGLLLAMPDLNTTDDRLYAIPGTPPNLLKKIVGDAFAPRNAFALNIDFEEEPPVYQISRTHEVSSWLEHPDAPKVKMPEALLKRIARMTGMANQKGGGV